MIRRHFYLALLILILFLNIVFAKYIVHQFFHQNYETTLIFVGLNIILFPIALLIYKLERNSKKSQHMKTDTNETKEF